MDAFCLCGTSTTAGTSLQGFVLKLRPERSVIYRAGHLLSASQAGEQPPSTQVSSGSCFSAGLPPPLRTEAPGGQQHFKGSPLHPHGPWAFLELWAEEVVPGVGMSQLLFHEGHQKVRTPYTKPASPKEKLWILLVWAAPGGLGPGLPAGEGGWEDLSHILSRAAEPKSWDQDSKIGLGGSDAGFQHQIPK